MRPDRVDTIDLLLRDHDPAKIIIFDNLVRGSTANVEAALRDPRVELVQGASGT